MKRFKSRVYPTLTLVTFLFLSLSAHVHAQNDGFGIDVIEVGASVAPLGLTNEDDIDAISEYGGYVMLISRNPDNLMLRISTTLGFSSVSSPPDVLSEGSFSMTRVDAFLLYGKYIYGGIGVGYYLITHELSADALNVYSKKGMEAEESIDDALGYSLKLGVKSKGTFGYFIESQLTILNTDANATITDLRTGNAASQSETLSLQVFHFFQVGLFYRF